mmetsp:Transcript_5485/g.19669  ORF Transcript_5485/g.19669 Transcript_5485/m.19669 type:complete len:812 (-) Transcript_5485:150-2585(-)|eukprot:CAMPEP_0203821100 /NCGR_PEP_ID=MMETSP0115-20131106/42122_1 /ASSEMBLY_ACC=CAM_ASM_000227 /TAXON_ID=33651 /ORGANISM="Bicosoecid sp, Strain ms1" /LENGTH=811 /DNA_ID=CAMNT_0050730121 /DNA_START=162 /DNA_END=2597 /DNA_ORIENTATION=-
MAAEPKVVEAAGVGVELDGLSTTGSAAGPGGAVGTPSEATDGFTASVKGGDGAAGGAGGAPLERGAEPGKDAVAVALREHSAEEADDDPADGGVVFSPADVAAVNGEQKAWWFTFMDAAVEADFQARVWYTNRVWRRRYVWAFNIFSAVAMISAVVGRKAPDDWALPTWSLVNLVIIFVCLTARQLIDGAAPLPPRGRPDVKRLFGMGVVSRHLARYRFWYHFATELWVCYSTTAEVFFACAVGTQTRWYRQCEDLAEGTTTHYQFAFMWTAINTLLVAVVLALPWYHSVLVNYIPNILMTIAIYVVAPSRGGLSITICVLVFPTVWILVRTFEIERRTSFTLQRVLKLRRKQALATVKAQDNVMNYVAHELRNPIHGAAGCARLLQGRVATMPGPVRTEVDAIRLCTDQLQRLVNDLLDLGRLRNGKLELKPTATNVVDVVRVACSSVMSMSQVPLRVTIEDSVPKVAVFDGLRVQQILINALTNAFKATEAGNVDLNVAFHANTILFLVRDTGAGLGGASGAELFEPFRQVDTYASTHVASTGLGLAICRSLVAEMGGAISLQDRTDRLGNPGSDAVVCGAQLAFSVPCSFVAAGGERLARGVRDPPSAGGGAMSWAMLASGAAGTLTLTPATPESDSFSDSVEAPDAEHDASDVVDQPYVIVADDVAVNRYVARRLLSSLGFGVMQVPDGKDIIPAIERAKRGGRTVTLVVTDIHMRVMGGIDALHEAHTKRINVPFVAVTGDNVALLDEAYFTSRGFAGVLPKPFTTENLVAVLAPLDIPGWSAPEVGGAAPGAGDAASHDMGPTRG